MAFQIDEQGRAAIAPAPRSREGRQQGIIDLRVVRCRNLAQQRMCLLCAESDGNSARSALQAGDA